MSKRTKAKTKKCSLCNNLIYLDVDNYCRLTDYFQGKFHTEKYYHNQCFTGSLKERKEMEAMKKATWELLKKAKQSFGGQKVEAA